MIRSAHSCSPGFQLLPTSARSSSRFRALQRDMHMLVMFITHDLGVVAEIADEVAVMYLGTEVERGSVAVLFSDPKHPYTRALLRSIPRLGTGRKQRLSMIRGGIPHPLNRPRGCSFHSRCEYAVAGVCDQQYTALVNEAGREVRCFLYGDPPLIQARAILQPEAEEAQTSVPTAQRPLMEVDDLRMYFPITSGFFNRTVSYMKAVDGVSFAIYEGETLDLVGESGCGKTTLGHTLLRLYAPTSGEIRYQPQAGQPVDLALLGNKQLKPYSREIRMIFQDPQASLNPRLPVFEIVGEVLKVNGLSEKAVLEERVRNLLRKVGLRPEYLRRYPHAFSGGERQRIGIARLPRIPALWSRTKPSPH